MTSTSPLVPIYDRLVARLEPLTFGPPVAVVYNPLDYAGAMHRAYLERFGRARGRVLFVGMNPGPFGMVQTGIPFGEVAAVRDFLGLAEPIGKPAREHPKRLVDGLACRRSEVSGQRLWGFFRERFGTAERFFERAFVANYCPLAFVEESGANRTPDKLPAHEREPLIAACDGALIEILAALAPSLVVGIGDFAKKRVELATRHANLAIPIGTILHPSPASPRANRGWAGEALRALQALGLDW